MKQLRWVLLPFSLIYGAITGLRNLLFDWGWKKTQHITGKSIVIGNLSVGGTGKTPLVIHLIEHFLEQNRTVATLSRGYGRKTKGVHFASSESTATSIGDEPLQYQTRFGDKVNIVVAEERRLGVNAIREKSNAAIILLDDAFQHRKVTGGRTILVTEFHRPFTNDFLLPAGRLRESRSGAKRADIILVSKCPENMSDRQRRLMKESLARYGQHVFFSSIVYGELEAISLKRVESPKKILLVTGIGNPSPLVEHLQVTFDVTHYNFADHHDFTAKDINEIHQKFNTFASQDAIIVTTEKDYMRLKKFKALSDGSFPWFYQPIKLKIDNETQFNNLLNTYVREN